MSKEEEQSTPKSPVRRMPLPYEVLIYTLKFISQCLANKILCVSRNYKEFRFKSKFLFNCSVFSSFFKITIMGRPRRERHHRLHHHRLIRSNNLLTEPAVPQLLPNILTSSVLVMSLILLYVMSLI